MDRKVLDNILPTTLLVLIISAALLGSLIYKKFNIQNGNQDSESNLPVKINPEIFSEDEKALLAPPGPQASKQEIEEHSKLAARLAVIGAEVEIKDCKASPIVLQNQITSPTTFRNTGNDNISITFEPGNILDVKAGKAASTTKVFTHGPGLYGYLCTTENFNGLVGYILVTP